MKKILWVFIQAVVINCFAVIVVPYELQFSFVAHFEPGKNRKMGGGQYLLFLAC